MSKVTFVDKTQTDAYDATKWNAQDANEIKDAINAAYDEIAAVNPGIAYNLPVATAETLGGVKAGANVTIAEDGTISVAAAGGGGGVSGLTPKELLYGKSDGTIEQNADLSYDPTTKSLYKGVGAAPAAGGNIYFFGTSITSGTGITTGGTKYSTLVATMLGFTEHNDGEPNSTLEKQSPINGNGGVNMVDRLGNIPTKGATDKYLVFEFGVNDFIYGGTNYNPTNFKSDFEAIINNALGKGWAASQILIFSPTFISPSQYGQTGPGGGTLTAPNYVLFQNAALAVSQEFGTLYFDVFNYIANRGGTYNLADPLHPNNIGHNLMAMGIMEALGITIYATGQGTAFNGNTSLAQLLLYTKYVIQDTQGLVLGVDSNGRVGVINGFGTSKFTGDINYAGKFVQIGANKPTAGLATNDLLLNQDAVIWGVHGNGYSNSIKLCDGFASMLFNIIYNNAQFKFSNVNGTVFTINPDGRLDCVGYINAPKLMQSGGAGTYGSFEPYTQTGATNQTNISNTYIHGYINFYNTNGVTNGTPVKTVAIGPTGQMILKTGLADGASYPSSRFSVDSTTEGILIPRMTAAQRDAIVSPAEGLEIYNLTTHTKNFYNGTAWRQITDTAA